MQGIPLEIKRRARAALTDLVRGPAVERMEIGGLVLAIVTNQETGFVTVHRTHNIVTDAGDEYYAELGAEESPTNVFDSMSLGTAASSAPGKGNDWSDLTEIASTNKLVKATYPLTNDTGDADNTGDGIDVTTWTFEWAGSDFNSVVITDGVIVAGAGAGSEPLLTHFEFTGGVFTKTATDTLKVIVNHTFTGV